ncbi:MAG TPA: HlyD family secretion protein [Xanthobacteraceae bacterium]|nr:HlyD family secretion protein [Xanthobacteraceae bacterium]
MYLDHEADIPAGRRAKSEQAERQALQARAPVDPELLRRWRDLDEEFENEGGPDVPALISTDEEAKHHIDAEPVPPRRRRRLALAGVALAIAVGAGGWFGYHWWTVGRFMVSTDDAYVQADNTTLAAKVAGYVANIYVADNSYVHAGDVIATIDDGDYRLAVDQARDKVATQQATVERIGRQIAAADANVDQAKAQLVSAQAGATRARLEAERQQALAAKQYASQQALEQAVANRDQANAAVKNADAAVAAAQANVAVLKAQQQEAARTLDELKTAQAKAERDLSFTTIRAPIDGVIGNRAMKVGDYVQPAQRLASVVPLDEVYVDANFKETQLARLVPGQKVDISVDALPGRTITGTVQSVSPASGSVFSLLPTDNATGNFTKIVQRLPVRIRVPLAVTGQRLLRPGMSVVVSVDTRDQPKNGMPVIAGAEQFSTR